MSVTRCPNCHRYLFKIEESSDNYFCLDTNCDFMYVNIKTGEMYFKDKRNFN